VNFIFDPSLVLYLPLYGLDGASFVSKDAYGHLCTVTGASWRPNGRYFDGADDYIKEATRSEALALTGAQTHLAWIYISALGGYGITARGIVASSNTSQAGCGVWLGSVNGDIRWQCNDGATAANLEATTGFVTTGVFHLIGVSWDGTTDAGKVLFINDGRVVDTDTSPVSSIIANPTVDNYFKIGIRYVSLSYGDFSGTIGEVWVYNRALSPQEIQHIYLATKWRYQ